MPCCGQKTDRADNDLTEDRARPAPIPPELPFRAPPPEWCVVAVTSSLGNGAESHFAAYGSLAESTGVQVAIVTDDLKTHETLTNSGKLWDVLLYKSPRTGEAFNWPMAANLGASLHRSAKRYLFLHDDIELPEDLSAENFLAKLQVAVDLPDSGLVVPMLDATGRCTNPAQHYRYIHKFADLPYFDLTEFVDSSAIAVSGPAFWGVGAWEEQLDGYGWWQVDLQKRLADAGRGSLVVPGVTVRHGERNPASAFAKPNASAEFRRNVKHFCKIRGLHAEREQRPEEVRLPPRKQGRNAHERSLCVVMGGAEDLPRLQEAMVASEKCEELVVVDLDPTPEVQAFVMAQRGATRARYAPAWDTLPIRQVLNLAGGREATLADLRSIEPAITAPRVRLGSSYALPQLVDHIDVAMTEGAGLGDTLMASSVLHA